MYAKKVKLRKQLISEANQEICKISMAMHKEELEQARNLKYKNKMFLLLKSKKLSNFEKIVYHTQKIYP